MGAFKTRWKGIARAGFLWDTMWHLCSHLPPIFIPPHNFIFFVCRLRGNKGSQAGSGAQIVIRETKSPQFQLLMAPNFRVPAGMWKPESSRYWSVPLFKLAQRNWNNILQLSDVFIIFLFLTKCSLQVFRFQFLQVFMLENYNNPPLFSTQNVCILK